MNLFGNIGNLSNLPIPSLYITFILLWSLFWKGLALWRAAGEKQRNWFIAILVLNTAGILEILYLFKFAKKKLTIGEIRSWLLRKS